MTISLDLIALSSGNVAILVIGALVWRRNFTSRSARTFFLATVSFATWLTFNYLSIQPFSPNMVDLMMRFSYSSGVWLMVAAWYFCYQFPIERVPTKLARISGLVLLIFGTIFSSSMMVVSYITIEDDKVFMHAGTLYALYGVLLAGLAIGALAALWRNYKASDLLQRNQIRYVAFGVSISTAVSITFNVILVPILGTSWGSVSANVLVVLPLVIFLGYALIRHRYTEIHRMLSWLTTYAICLGITAGWIFAVQTVLPRLFPDSINTQHGGIVIAATIAIFLFQPFSRAIRTHTDRIFSVGWYDSQLFLNEMGAMLAGERQLAPLLKKSLDSICSALQVTNGLLLVIDEHGDYQKEVFGDLKQPSTQTLLPKSHQIIIADELAHGSPVLGDFETDGWRVGVPLETRGSRIGYLYLGIKEQGDIFTPQDISVLRILSNQLAVAIVSAQAFDQISSFNATLQQQVAEATTSLRTANDKLQVEDRMKTEFIILTSHNLRTPLSIIKGYISLIEDTKLDGAQMKMIGAMKEGLGRLSQFTEDLLAIDALVAGHQLVLEPITANAVLEPLIKEASEMNTNKEVAFITNIDDAGDLVINANTLRLSGAIRNLLDNAFKFTKQGQVSLTVGKHKDMLQITVSDSGIGISKEELPNLFTRFHRATSALQYDYDGEGIGLYLTSLVVKEHGGSIEAHSRLGEGSQFIVKLPL